MDLLWLGIGCGRGQAAATLIAVARAVLERPDLADARLVGAASLDSREGDPALAALAAALAVPIRFFPPDRLEAETPRLTHRSARVFALTGCHGIAEAAALAAAGPDAVLAVPRHAVGRVTVAVARMSAPCDA